MLFLVSKGYATLWPETFEQVMGSALSNAMDVARGGQFENISRDFPSKILYPEDAWFTNDDATCNYACQNTNYFYWSLTTMLGA